MTKLPQGWEWKSLDEICEIVMGQSPNGNCIFNKDKNKDLIEFHQGKIAFSDKYINKSDFVTSDIRKIAKKNSVVLSVRAPVGEVNITSEDIAIGRGLCSINGIKINNEFLFFYLLTLKKYFNDNSTGSTFKAISTKIIKETKIPLPPLKEQERIVGILDESFAKIDESIKILEQDLLNLDELMQSALQKAFNPLKDNAKENYKLPQGWEWKSLGEICEIIGGGTPSKQIKQYWENGTIKWATVRDMNTETIEDTEFRITNLGLDNSSTNIINQDFILIATRVGLGKVCLVKDTLAINQDLKGILPHKSLDKKYLFYFFKKNKDFLIENGIGATVKGVSVDFIKSLQIPLPPLKEQEQIASHLDELSSHVKNLKQNYQAQIKDLQELKKSLLDKAFKGNL
ncbi:TPA: restriction endonuclease subunit S [Campylobacter coli]|nr:restriction endonuclease subunit S [Campylobacter coli]